MAKKNNSVSYKVIEEALKGEYRDEELVTWNDIDIIVKKKIGIEDVINFVSQVADASFDENGDYHPEFREFLYRQGVVIYFTNINLPKDSAKQFDFLYSGDFFSTIENNIDEEFLFDIRCAIEQKIEYRIKMSVEAINKMTIERFNSFDGLLSDLENIGAMLSDEDLKKLIEVVSSDKFEVDEGALAKAIVELRK